MQLALDDAGLAAAGHRARERARHVHAAQRRGRGRGDPQGVRRPRAPGHVDQGRHRPPDRRGRCGRGGDRAAVAPRRRSCPPTANLERIGDDIDLDVVAGEPRADRAGAGAVELVRVRRPQRHAGPRACGSTFRRVIGRRTADARLRAPQRRRSQRRCEISTGGTVSWFRLDGRQAPRRDRHRRGRRRSSGRCASRSSSGSRSSGGSPPRAPTSAKASPRCTRGVGSPRRSSRRVGRRADRARRRPARACRARRSLLGIADHVS